MNPISRTNTIPDFYNMEYGEFGVLPNPGYQPIRNIDQPEVFKMDQIEDGRSAFARLSTDAGIQLTKSDG